MIGDGPRQRRHRPELAVPEPCGPADAPEAVAPVAGLPGMRTVTRAPSVGVRSPVAAESRSRSCSYPAGLPGLPAVTDVVERAGPRTRERRRARVSGCPARAGELVGRQVPDRAPADRVLPGSELRSRGSDSIDRRFEIVRPRRRRAARSRCSLRGQRRESPDSGPARRPARPRAPARSGASDDRDDHDRQRGQRDQRPPATRDEAVARSEQPGQQAPERAEQPRRERTGADGRSRWASSCAGELLRRLPADHRDGGRQTVANSSPGKPRRLAAAGRRAQRHVQAFLAHPQVDVEQHVDAGQQGAGHGPSHDQADRADDDRERSAGAAACPRAR